jgi:hypothetical protein
LILAGGIVFVEQLLNWVREREWETVTLRAVLLDTKANTSTPLLLRWLSYLGSGWQGVVVDLLDLIPLWAFFLVVGGWMTFRASRVGR